MKTYSKKTKLLLVAAIFYVIMPQDLIPDYLIGFGQIDDAAVIGLLIQSIRNDRKKQKIKKDN